MNWTTDIAYINHLKKNQSNISISTNVFWNIDKYYTDIFKVGNYF